MKEIALVYMVAGISSRFGGKIKQFAIIGKNQETLIEYSLNQAIPAGFAKIIFIVGEKTEKLFKEKFGNEYKEIPIFYVLQRFNLKDRDKPWGTGDALCSAIGIIDCPFIVCNGDDIYGKETFEILRNHLEKENTNSTIGYKLAGVIPDKGTVNRGIFEIDSDNNVKSIKEIFEITKDNLKDKQLSENSLCSMNIFALIPEVIGKLNNALIKFKQEHKGDKKVEFLLPKELNNLIKEGKIKMKMYPTYERWFGITNPGDEIKIREQLKNLTK